MLQFLEIDMDLNAKLYLNCTLYVKTLIIFLKLWTINVKNPLPYFCTVDISLCQFLNSSYWLDCLETPHNIEQNILMLDQKDWRSDNRILDKCSTYLLYHAPHFLLELERVGCSGCFFPSLFKRWTVILCQCVCLHLMCLCVCLYLTFVYYSRFTDCLL